MRSSSARPSRRGPPAAPTRQSMPRRGKAVTKISASSRSSRAIWRLSSPRASARIGERRAVPTAGAGASPRPVRLSFARPREAPAPSGPSVARHRRIVAARTPPQAGRLTQPRAPRAAARAPPRRRCRERPRPGSRATSMRSVRRSTPRPEPIAPNSSATDRSRRRSRASRPAARPGRPSSVSPARLGRIPSGACTQSASKARSATPDSMIAIVSASSSRLLLTKPPFRSRSSASASTGVGCSSGSRPMWRKKTR